MTAKTHVVQLRASNTWRVTPDLKEYAISPIPLSDDGKRKMSFTDEDEFADALKTPGEDLGFAVRLFWTSHLQKKDEELPFAMDLDIHDAEANTEIASLSSALDFHSLVFRPPARLLID